jgi:hypothetical protein
VGVRGGFEVVLQNQACEILMYPASQCAVPKITDGGVGRVHATNIGEYDLRCTIRTRVKTGAIKPHPSTPLLSISPLSDPYAQEQRFLLISCPLSHCASTPPPS